MTTDENYAIGVANQYVGTISIIEKVKYLGTEYAELCMAIANDDHENIQEEIGDMAYILLHIASYYGEQGLQDLVDKAVGKMIARKGMKNR